MNFSNNRMLITRETSYASISDGKNSVNTLLANAEQNRSNNKRPTQFHTGNQVTPPKSETSDTDLWVELAGKKMAYGNYLRCNKKCSNPSPQCPKKCSLSVKLVAKRINDNNNISHRYFWTEESVEKLNLLLTSPHVCTCSSSDCLSSGIVQHLTHTE